MYESQSRMRSLLCRVLGKTIWPCSMGRQSTPPSGLITHLIRGLDVRKSVPDAITAMQSLGQNDLALFNGETIHAAEWTHHTFNPWTGCTKVSPGCDHCYAESWAKRSGLVQWGDNPRRRVDSSHI